MALCYNEEMSNEHPPHHVPVLLDSVLSLLSPKAGESYLDLTAGYGGHAGAIIEKTKNYKDSMLVDRDDYAISHLSSFEQHGTRLMHSDFVAAAQALVQEKKTFDIILIDLGVSSPQLDQGE
ncbi:16S rRNA (cytosine(1402)-N(4))-methyltransferase, partial [Candidatus Saccharibacteria bacterium]|nr:16S rRNA (cytosine(1402)-N(4))-methyltransferase [Candidatus Saccharibacteria bacterium]